MSNRITSCEYIGRERLTITAEALGFARYDLSRKVWEGGKSVEPFTGLRVNDGEVTAHDVVIQLGKADR